MFKFILSLFFVPSLLWSGPAIYSDMSEKPTYFGNKTIDGNLSVNGNTTLGDAAADLVTINASSITLINQTTIYANINPLGILGSLSVSTSSTAGIVGLSVSTNNAVGIGTSLAGSNILLDVVSNNANNVGLRVSSSVYMATLGGLVGIGTTNSNVELNVVGRSSFTANSSISALSVTNSGSGNLATFLGSGNVGIGVTSTLAPLHMDKSGNNFIRFDEGGAVRAMFGVSSGGGQIIILDQDNDVALRSQSNLLIASGGSTERARFDTNGNLGIGTTTPFGLFQVGGGTITASSDGRVGIGTTTARSSAQVWRAAGVGGSHFTVSTGTTNLFEVNGASISIGPVELSVTSSTRFNSVLYTWPGADGSANQSLTTNGSGILSWATAGSGINNQSNLQTGATFYVSSGSVNENFYVARNGIGTLGISSTSVLSDVKFVVSTFTFVVSSKGTTGRVGIYTPEPANMFSIGQGTYTHLQVERGNQPGEVYIQPNPVAVIVGRNSTTNNISLQLGGSTSDGITSDGRLEIRDGNANRRWSLYANGSSQLQFLNTTNNRVLMRFDALGGDGFHVGFGNSLFSADAPVVDIEQVGTDALLHISSNSSTFPSLVVAGSGNSYNVGIRKSAPAVPLDLGTNAQFGLGIYVTPRGNLTPGKAGAVIYDSNINRVCVATATNANSWTFMDNAACQ